MTFDLSVTLLRISSTWTFPNDSMGKNVSLLAKWMPSENVSGKGEKAQHTRMLAQKWSKALRMSARQYRVSLSQLRKRIGVVESKMSSDNWDNIEYPFVPSRAMKLYRKAFERHDESRFHAFVNKAITGEVKINSKTLYPHEIVYEYMHGKQEDKVLEAMWNQLPDYFKDDAGNVLVIVDTSSSMLQPTSLGSKSKVQAMDVSVALGIYCAERNKGAFHNIIMTFNSNPEFVEIDRASLRFKVNQVRGIEWGGSTNLQKAFQNLLTLAVENEIPAEDMPDTILIVTDAEFDRQIDGKTNFEGSRINIARQDMRCLWLLSGMFVQEIIRLL